MSEQQNEFKGFARVEVMGHQTHIGYVETQAFGGVVLFRIDQPALPEEEEALKRATWIGDTLAAVGSVVKREAVPPVSVLVGAASIYRIIPCDEEAMKEAVRQSAVRPLHIVKLAEAKLISAANVSREQDEDDEQEEYMDHVANVSF